MAKTCNNTSVGIIIARDDALLLIERKKFPFGFACPAGHVDEGEAHEAAAARELEEETGLTADRLECLLDKRFENPCRRAGGDWHHWQVFRAEASGELRPSADETKQAVWCSGGELSELAARTARYESGNITEEEWQCAPGLEPVWRDILTELGYL